jgi:hypothetical protein
MDTTVWVDMVRGIGSVLFIMAVAGGIAYVGDRVGHQVGRRRLTLFGIRPRYTSTIVAVGTGMLIAFLVTMIALLASNQVKTAFFKLNQLNEQIDQLQARETALQNKVDKGQLVVPVDSLMYPYFGTIPRGTPADRRVAIAHTFYDGAVAFINQVGPQLGLKKFVPPADIEKRLDNLGAPDITRESFKSDLLLVCVADQNLYRNDEVHFGLTLIADTRRAQRGQALAELTVPGGKGANLNLAINELQQLVTNVAVDQHKMGLPPFLGNHVQVVATLPDAAQMQKTIDQPGTYIVTAFAAVDIYPHTGGVPIAVALTRAP